MSLLAVNTPSVSKELMDKIEKNNPPLQPIPNVTTIEEIMYDAGKQDLIRWIKSQTTQRTVTGQAL